MTAKSEKFERYFCPYCYYSEKDNILNCHNVEWPHNEPWKNPPTEKYWYIKKEQRDKEEPLTYE